jgi:hypothetical protein
MRQFLHQDTVVPSSTLLRVFARSSDFSGNNSEDLMKK